MTPAEWAKAVLTQIGAPTTSANIKAMVSWAQAEGGNWKNSAKYNPINTELGQPGSTSMGGGSKVQSYTTWQQGIAAAAQTIKQPNMAPILAALKGGQGCGALATALSKAPWGTSASLVAKNCGQPYNPGSPTPATTLAKTTPTSGGLDLNPLDWPGLIVGDLLGAVMSPVSRIFWGFAGAALAVLGLTLLVLSSFAPARKTAKGAATGAIEGGPAGAAVGAASGATKSARKSAGI